MEIFYSRIGDAGKELLQLGDSIEFYNAVGDSEAAKTLRGTTESGDCHHRLSGK